MRIHFPQYLFHAKSKQKNNLPAEGGIRTGEEFTVGISSFGLAKNFSIMFPKNQSKKIINNGYLLRHNLNCDQNLDPDLTKFTLG